MRKLFYEYKWVWSDLHEVGTYKWVMKPFWDAVISFALLVGLLAVVVVIAVMLK